MDPRRVVEENEIQDAEKPMAKHFENLFEKEEDKLMLVETIRNELRKTEKEEETPHQDKKSLKRKTKQKSSYSRKVKRTSARLEERIKKEQKEERTVSGWILVVVVFHPKGRQEWKGQKADRLLPCRASGRRSPSARS